MQNLEISTESCYQRDARMVNFLSESLELPRKSRIFATIKRKNDTIMEASTQHFTAQDWAEHAQFVQMFRAAKQRKHEWQAKMEATLAEKAEKIRRRREEIDKLFEK